MLAGSPSRALLRSHSAGAMRSTVPAQRLGLETAPKAEKKAAAPRTECGRPLETDLLGEAFMKFCGGPHMSCKNFEKLCRHCLLINSKFSATDASSVFLNLLPENQRRLDLQHFEAALKLIAERKCVPEDTVRRAVMLCAGSSAGLPRQVKGAAGEDTVPAAALCSGTPTCASKGNTRCHYRSSSRSGFRQSTLARTYAEVKFASPLMVY